MEIQKLIDSIDLTLKSSESFKPSLAELLYSAKTNINWKETEYKSFRGFCNTKINLSFSSVYKYVNVAKRMQEIGYDTSDAEFIIKRIGWERFSIGLMQIDISCFTSVGEFIIKYKDINLNKRITYGNKEFNLETFSFSLPKESAELLTNELIVRGMRTSGKNRINASTALIRLVEDIQQQR